MKIERMWKCEKCGNMKMEKTNQNELQELV